jgi:hypothetical protein
MKDKTSGGNSKKGGGKKRAKRNKKLLLQQQIETVLQEQQEMDEIVNKYTSVTRTNTATAGEDFLCADFETALEHSTPENFIDVKEDA